MAVTKKRPATRPSDLDDQMRQSLMDIRLLESSARVLQSRLDIVTAALSETLTAISTLEGTKGKPDETETLVPIGSGSFVKARLADAEKVIIGVGAGVCIEKPIEDSMKDLRLRSSELEKARATVTQQLNQVYGQTEDYRAHLNDLARKKGGGTVEIV
ncbi:prefoldin subunit alpha [archaeon 13_1_40CM_4_53_4]|nr:MAG: prefoldin subunit alpha [archaeon 13_2_20CM_2_53_6]OLC61261.1 MAG: prefoldin subunit alpha [archaeon 13_1_40CM_4_53_4]OLE58395.1 MAG: prefoldin subunit alpha [Crenarchaeota archaeon 13_1_20CM_2_53_14]TMI25874.1 MAG: prefoldin subunit alpha [Candidatus Bathyarchaeota archaeon]